jgi:hypothetical protein
VTNYQDFQNTECRIKEILLYLGLQVIDFHSTTRLLPFSTWIHILMSFPYLVSIKNKNRGGWRGKERKKEYHIKCSAMRGPKFIQAFEHAKEFCVPQRL